jgi:hypothetical protein
MSSLGEVGRSGELPDLSGGLTALGAGLTIYSYSSQGDPMWQAATKALIVTGSSYVGAIVGAAGGVRREVLYSAQT